MDKFSNWNKEKYPLFEKLKNFFTPSKKISFKEKISDVIYSLDFSLNKLKNNSINLQRRDQKFFDKCIISQVNNDNKRAILYANECAEIRKLARLILSSELALEHAILRLQTVGELSDIIGSITPVVDIITETKGRLSGIIPSVAGKLDEVTTILNKSISEIGSVSIKPTKVIGANNEAKKILDEANVAAEEQIREKFPTLPQELPKSESIKNKIPVAITTSGDEFVINNDLLKNKVYNYIKDHDGKLSVVQCSSYFGVFPKDIKKVILSLKNEGKITLDS